MINKAAKMVVLSNYAYLAIAGLTSRLTTDNRGDCGGTMPDCGGTLIGDSTLDNEVKVLKKRVGTTRVF